jgi:GntR family phosphonate transport system transcriptional regulator
MTKLSRTEIAPQGGVALWRQIADQIRLDIVGGKLEVDDKLDGELPLAKRFGVNRHTVRRAIAVLVEEGVLRAEQGRGTFVASARRLSYQLGRRTRFREGLKGQAQTLTSESLGHRQENATQRIATALGLGRGARLVRIDGLNSADGFPISRATTWLPYRRFPDFAERIAELGSTTATFKSYGIVDYVRMTTRISARHADAEELKLLKLAPGAVLLVSEAVDADEAGTPISYGLSRFPADRLELVV